MFNMIYMRADFDVPFKGFIVLLRPFVLVIGDKQNSGKFRSANHLKTQLCRRSESKV